MTWATVAEFTDQSENCFSQNLPFYKDRFLSGTYTNELCLNELAVLMFSEINMLQCLL